MCNLSFGIKISRLRPNIATDFMYYETSACSDIVRITLGNLMTLNDLYQIILSSESLVEIFRY